MKPSPIHPELLEKYLKGLCTPEEKRKVEDWYFEIDKNFETPLMKMPVFDKMKLFGEIQQQVADLNELEMADVEEWETPAPAKVLRFSKRLTWMAGVAAVLIVVLGVGFFVRTRGEGASLVTAKQSEHIVLYNNTAAIVEKTLPDGSAVWLKPGSNLTYERKDEESNREVTFTGEAFFDVAKDAQHPFVIHANEMKIRVIGTSFNVIALPSSRTFKVSVVTGKVQVTGKGKSGKTESVYLTPKHQASFNLSSQKIIQTELSEVQLKKQYWKPFSLNFKDATMEVVAKEMQKAFQVKVEFSNPDIANCHLRVDFNNQQLPEIISLLEKLLDVNCELADGSTLKIAGEGCSE
ncbi:MAG TPA: FecR family protein [Chitinophagaceae bacterium]|nr:FecR family protein [Chitinophagaceae bacterium]